jgi:hypothetical protein
MNAIRAALVLLALGCAEPSVTAPLSDAPRVPSEQDRNQQNSFYINPAERSIYVKIAQVRGENVEPIYSFMREVFVSADAANSERLVIDLRSLAGSDTRLVVPLVKGVAARERFARRGGLFVVVGDASFSPHQRAATLLQQYANPIFVRHPPE